MEGPAHSTVPDSKSRQTPTDLRPSPLPPRAWADAALAGWLPLIAINAVFVQRVNIELTFRQQTFHHLYDGGQLLGLGVLSWLLANGLMRVPRWPRIALALTIAGFASYGLLGGDLESFLERHRGTGVPWRLLFGIAGAAGLATSCALGMWIARHRVLRFAVVAIGLASAVANHLVLELAYPGTHFIVAWSAALLIGLSIAHDIARLSDRSRDRAPRAHALALTIAGAASLASFVIMPGAVVRGALLGSSGAIAAPFVAELWASFEPDAVHAIGHYDPAWFAPRRHLPPIPAERPSGAPDKPIVIMLTVDALRADTLHGPTVVKRSVQHLRAMESKALSFERAWSPAPYTMASLRSLFLGIYYFQQNAKPPRGQRKPSKGPFLAALLAHRDVNTVNIQGAAALGTSGSVSRGFAEEIKPRPRSSEGVVKAVLDRLDRATDEPLFIYSHIIDPHAPYIRGDARATAKERYLAEVEFVDRRIGRLRSELRKRGLDKRTYFILSADHGEAFGEHGHYFHSTTVYQEMIHVPLIIEGPGVAPRRVAQPVSLLDVAPTILSIFGVDTPGHFMGQSLVPFMRGEDPALSRVLAVDGSRTIRAMLFEGRWKAIVDVKRGTEELYDLQNDPGERRNLAEEPQARAYIATLHAFFASAGKYSSANASVPAN